MQTKKINRERKTNVNQENSLVAKIYSGFGNMLKMLQDALLSYLSALAFSLMRLVSCVTSPLTTI